MLKIAWAPEYAHPLPEGHRFPMEKYNLLPEQLLYEGTIQSSQLFRPEPISEESILLLHESVYWNSLKNNTLDRLAIRRTGFPLSPQLVHRERVIMQGTIDCVQHALQYGVAMNIAGGTHHAFADRGEGFCLLNDIALAAVHYLQLFLHHKVLIIDLDVHQGNGTASIFRDDPSVFTFSMHGGKNYPMIKEHSDLDVELEDGIDDSTYLRLLNHHLEILFDVVQPNLVLFQSGVDILDTDKLGRLNVTKGGCKKRDKMVFEACKKNNVPVVAAMGGGYSPRIADVIEAHANTFRVAQEIF